MQQTQNQGACQGTQANTACLPCFHAAPVSNGPPVPPRNSDMAHAGKLGPATPSAPCACPAAAAAAADAAATGATAACAGLPLGDCCRPRFAPTAGAGPPSAAGCAPPSTAAAAAFDSARPADDALSSHAPGECERRVVMPL